MTKANIILSKCDAMMEKIDDFKRDLKNYKEMRRETISIPKKRPIPDKFGPPSRNIDIVRDPRFKR